MKCNLLKTIFSFLFLGFVTHTMAQCVHCSNPVAPSEYGGAPIVTQYKNSVLQLWAATPTTAVDGRNWYKVKSAGDTTYVGSGDTVTVTMDTTSKFIARNINSCTCGGTYYSSYALMATVTVVDSPSVPQFWIDYSATVCSRSQTNIFCNTKATTVYAFQYLRDNTTNITGSSSGTVFQSGPMGITLTNTTSSPQQVRFLVKMFKNGGAYFDSKSFYVTVMPDSPTTSDHCKFPSQPRVPITGNGTTASMTFAKGGNIELWADTTVVADNVDWYKVVGTDTTFIGSGYDVSQTADTTCKFLARSRNNCSCNSTAYYSSYYLMYNITVDPTKAHGGLKVVNYMPTIASGTQLNINLQQDETDAYPGFGIYRDNANVTGQSSGVVNPSDGYNNPSAFAYTLTNNTSVPQKVRLLCYQAQFSATWYGNMRTVYVTVLPASSMTGTANNHCYAPRPIFPSTQQIGYVKGANVILDLNQNGTGVAGGAPYFLSHTEDQIDWFQVRAPGDTIVLPPSPVRATIDTPSAFYTVQKNVCYWSDSSKHTYVGNTSKVLTTTVTTATMPTVTLTNNNPNVCYGGSTNISASKANTTKPILWFRDNFPVGGTRSSSNSSSPIVVALTDTPTTPQKVNFISYSYITVSGVNYYGSHALTSVLAYPSSNVWATNHPVSISAVKDTVLTGGVDTLFADSLPGAVIQWYKGSCGGHGSNYLGSGNSIIVTVDSPTTYYARYRDYCTLNDTTIIDTANVTCSSKTIKTRDAIGKELLHLGYDVVWDSVHTGFSDNKILPEQNATISFAVVAKDSPINVGFYYLGESESDYSSGYNNRGYSIGWDNGAYYVLHLGTRTDISTSVASVRRGDIVQIDKVDVDIYYRVNDAVIYHDVANEYNRGLLAMGYWDSHGRPASYIVGPTAIINPVKSTIRGLYKKRPINPSQCPSDQYRNWTYTVTYDEAENAVTETKVFSDELGRAIQSQVLNHTFNVVLATQTIYDAYGRPVIQTLPAPTGNTTLCYQEHFVTSAPGVDYSYVNFEGVDENGSNKERFPDIVGTDANSVGYYYSSSNTREMYVPTTSFPYSRTDYYPDIRGMVRQVGTPGDRKHMSEHTARQMTFPVQERMTRYLALRNVYVPTGPTGLDADNGLFRHCVMTVSIDQNGKKVASYTDEDGHTLAQANIGTDVTYSGTPGSFYTAFGIQSNLYEYNHLQPVGAGKYVEAFIQYNNQPITSSYNDHDIRIYDMITDDLVYTLTANTTYTTLPVSSGFYRFESDGDFIIAGLAYNFKEFSYSIYDDAGRLVAQIAPRGAAQTVTSSTTPGDLIFANNYAYNTLGWLMSKTTPDEGAGTTVPGRTDYLYNIAGQVRFSQNARQRLEAKFNYSVYDNTGRPIEIGEYNPTHFSTSPLYSFGTISGATDVSTIADQNDGMPETGVSNKTFQRYFAYDLKKSDFPSSAGAQSFMLSAVTKMWDASGNKSWYSHDEAGHLITEVQSVPDIGTRKMIYTYGLRGNMRGKKYPEENLSYTYEYDDDQRLQKVYTSHNANGPLEIQAYYGFYMHGPLKRIELGDLTQGIDYIYTIEGWLKSINHPDLDPTKDPGADGNVNGGMGHGSFGQDAFGMALDYYHNDYINANSYNKIGAWAEDFNTPEVFNGSIKNQRWNSATPSGMSFPGFGTYGMIPKHYLHAYKYDEKYQLTEAKFGQAGSAFNGTTFVDAYVLGDNYKEQFSYDANGNILTLLRNGYVDANGNGELGMDNLTYHYANTTSNRLEYVEDQVTSTTNGYTQDIESQGSGNYSYDLSGRMIGNVKDGQYIDYDPYGKVIAVYTDQAKTNLKVQYAYNERGYRSRKTLYSSGGPTHDTYYITDISGRVAAIYEKDYHAVSGSQPAIVQTEVPIYGAGRIGVLYPLAPGSPPDQPGLPVVVNYKTVYELSDHLGNVRVTLRKEAGSGQYTVERADGYYATGQLLPGMQLHSGSSYRYGYQGQYSEMDGETGWNDFEARNYDSRIGRWLIKDPVNQYWSPYMAMGNDWINTEDEDGRLGDPVTVLTKAGAKALGSGLEDIFGQLVINRLNLELHPGSESKDVEFIGPAMSAGNTFIWATIDGFFNPEGDLKDVAAAVKFGKRFFDISLSSLKSTADYISEFERTNHRKPSNSKVVGYLFANVLVRTGFLIVEEQLHDFNDDLIRSAKGKLIREVGEKVSEYINGSWIMNSLLSQFDFAEFFRSSNTSGGYPNDGMGRINKAVLK